MPAVGHLDLAATVVARGDAVMIPRIAPLRHEGGTVLVGPTVVIVTLHDGRTVVVRPPMVIVTLHDGGTVIDGPPMVIMTLHDGRTVVHGPVMLAGPRRG